MPRRELKSICGWMTPQKAAVIKERIKAINIVDPQYSESRIVNEAIAEYLPKLEKRHAEEMRALGVPARDLNRGHA